jgi:hypothetical protein
MSQNIVQNPVTPSKDAAGSSPKNSPSKPGEKSKTAEGDQMQTTAFKHECDDCVTV